MKTSHTPGPWYRMDKRYADNERCNMEICTFDGEGRPNARIATVHDCVINPLQEHSDEVEANAKLIASAPDMLKALEWAQACFHLYLYAENTEPMTYYAADAHHALELIEKTIAEIKK